MQTFANKYLTEGYQSSSSQYSRYNGGWFKHPVICMSLPRISFGLIVLNSEPFIRYNLRALYPFAHQLLVVEGAVEAARGIATADGHSRDATLETLHDFKANEDSEDKLHIITRNGFWLEKDEMSQAYAERATGDYLWQVDGDEFYRTQDMQRVLNLLADDSSISAMSFHMRTFWGAPNMMTDGWYLQRGASQYHRLFKWGDGYTYVTHRPPTVTDKQGRNVRSLHWLDGDKMREHDIEMFHYSLLFPKHVLEKCEYYASADWAEAERATDWAQEAYLQLNRPFRVHNTYQYPSWLQRFDGEHPAQILAMWQDIENGEVEIERRPMADAEALVDSIGYQLGREVVRYADYPVRWWKRVGRLRRRIQSAIGRRMRS